MLASVCAACLAAPFVAGLVALLVEARVPVRLGGDSALIELATREASEGARLLGPYSRFGWNHPGPLLAVACAGRALAAVRSAWPHGLRLLRPGPLRSGLVAAGMALAALAWAPPLADQLTAAGNLGALARFFLGGGPGYSTAEGWQAFVHGGGTLPFGLPPERPGPVAPGAKLAVVALAALVSGAAVVGSRRGERFAAWLGAFGLPGGTVAVGLATRISGVILGYLLFWMAAVPVAGLLGGAVLAARGLRGRSWPRCGGGADAGGGRARRHARLGHGPATAARGELRSGRGQGAQPGRGRKRPRP